MLRCFVCPLALLLMVTGCASLQQVLYQSTQGWQQNQCQMLIDTIEREQCLRKSGTTYEEYKRQTEDGKR